MKNEKGTIVLAGGVIGVIAAILVFFGNPAKVIKMLDKEKFQED